MLPWNREHRKSGDRPWFRLGHAVWCDCGVSRWRCLIGSWMWGRESRRATWNLPSLIPTEILRMSGFTQDGYWWEESWCVTPDPHDHSHFPNILDELCLQRGIKFLGATFGLITLILPESGIFSSSIPNSRPLRLGFPGGSDGKESACDGGDLGSIPGLGSSPGEGKGYPLFLLGEFQGQRSLVGYSPWRVTKSQKQVSDFHFNTDLWDYTGKIY